MSRRRPPTTRRRLELLDELYARIPAMECRGKCAHSCSGAIMSTADERDRIDATGGPRMPAPDDWPPGNIPCPQLNILGACRVYDVRPAICRLWGTTAAMQCPHGCRPVGGAWLSDSETLEILIETMEIDGSLAPGDAAIMREVIGDPAAQPALYALLRRDASGVEVIRAAVSRARHPTGRE